VAYPPFGLMLTIDTPLGEDFGRISHFGQFDYNERAEVRVVALVGEVHTPYPGDYRTLEEVLREAAKDRN
jgi:hypothetical protein